ncbi:hypothetical protein KKA39_02450 [Patescibacteria group bacterium]|nr:hypothetical protein [Patescibacteria group bacterium]MBU1728137.1 hypothetical protein [Patescibacteria group bacterium]
MNSSEKIEWSAPEYEDKKRNVDWFWALGVIVIAVSITSIIYGNYFFAILIIISGILLGFFAVKKPETVFYELNKKGLKIKTRLFPFENIKAFWVQTSPKQVLFIKSERLFMPIISVPIENNFGEEIRSIMLAHNVTEEEMKENPSEKIMDKLGF